MDPSLSQNHAQFPPWFSPESGVYSSLHPPRSLPGDPFTDLVSFLFSHKQSHAAAATAIALVESSSGVSFSYQRLQELIFSLAAGIHSRFAVSKGHLILLLLPNSVLFPVVLLAALSLGAVVVVMNPQSTRDEIKKHLGGGNLSLAFTSPENIDKVDAFGAPVVPIPGEGFHELLCGDFGEVPRPEIRQSDTAVILFSSGTSGRSKGVILTHANLIAMVELFVRFEALQYGRDSSRNVYLAAIPMFHVYGLSLFAIGLLSAGSKVVVMSRFNVDAAMKAIDAFGVTHFPVVPPILLALIRASGGGGAATGSKLSSLVQVSCGAAPLTKKVIEEFLKAFPHVDLIQGYGMTESSAIGTRGFNGGNKKLKKYTSVGLLAPNMLAKVVDCKTGSCLPPGESGELWLHGPGIMKGYLDDEKATLSAMDEYGWLRTGDIAHFDDEGYMYIKDRLKDTIKYKGFQIAPADLEAVLISHPAIVDVAVTSEEDEGAGEIPVAFVVRAHGSTISAEELIQYVGDKVAPYKKIRKVTFVQSIPKSAAGKTLRRLLKNHLGASSSSSKL